MPPEHEALELEDGLLVDLEEGDVRAAVHVAAHVEPATHEDDLAGSGRDPAFDEPVEVARAEADHRGGRRERLVELPGRPESPLVREPLRVGVVEERVGLLLLHGADGRDHECGRADFIDVDHWAFALSNVRLVRRPERYSRRHGQVNAKAKRGRVSAIGGRRPPLQGSPPRPATAAPSGFRRAIATR